MEKPKPSVSGSSSVAVLLAAGAVIAVCTVINPAAIWLLAVWAVSALVLGWTRHKRAA